MKILNDSKMTPGWLINKIHPCPVSATFLVKGTFDLRRDASAVLAAKQEGLSGDIHEENDPSRNICYPSDFAWFKPNTDLLLAGTCHQPGGRPNVVCNVTFQVGRWIKHLAVVGDRVQMRRLLFFSSLSSPKPFRAMRLSYDRSYGGPRYAKNSWGIGHEYETTKDGRRIRRLPNLYDPDLLAVDPFSRPDPAGFGPLPQTAPQRTHGMGHYGKRWRQERWPGYPADYDWSMQNAAPWDQQLPCYLRGDERLFFRNLHRIHSDFATRLPGLRARWFLNEKPESGPRFREVPLHLDTLWVDTEAEKLILIWRGFAPVRHKKMPEVLDHFILSEPLSSTSRSLDDYASLFAARKNEEAQKAKGGREKLPEISVPQPKLPDMSWKKRFDAEMAQMREECDRMTVQAEKHRAEALEKLRGKGIEPDTVPPVTEKEIEAVYGKALARFRRAQSVQPELAAAMGTLPTFQELGISPLPQPPARPQTPAGAPPVRPQPEPWTRESCVAHAEGGGNFKDQDLSGLDLSGLVLNRCSFAGATLTNANLKGSNLRGADFQRANLSRANLREAVLSGAILTRADLTEADLSGADLREATLDGAEISKADLSSADLTRVSGKRAIFIGANLEGARICQAQLTGADLRETNLTKADLTQANLRSASAGKSRGPQAKMPEADLTGFRAGQGADFRGGDFRSVKGPKSVWEGALLDGTDFGKASLLRSNFSAASLKKANFSQADLRRARLSEANLEGAVLLKTNLFKGHLGGAILRGTDLRGSNLYEVEFLEATVEESSFQLADLTGTKLDR